MKLINSLLILASILATICVIKLEALYIERVRADAFAHAHSTVISDTVAGYDQAAYDACLDSADDLNCK